MAYLKLLAYIPDLLKIVKIIYSAIKSGKSKAEIKLGIKGIESAFDDELKPVEKAEKLNEVFNKKLQ